MNIFNIDINKLIKQINNITNSKSIILDLIDLELKNIHKVSQILDEIKKNKYKIGLIWMNEYYNIKTDLKLLYINKDIWDLDKPLTKAIIIKSFTIILLDNYNKTRITDIRINADLITLISTYIIIKLRIENKIFNNTNLNWDFDTILKKYDII